MADHGRGWIAMLLAVAATACAARTEPVSAGGPWLRTLDDAYALPHSGSVQVTARFTNHAARTLYVGHCGGEPPGFTLEKQTADGWTRAYVPFCFDIAAPPVSVPPGGTFTGTMTLLHVTAPNTLSPFVVPEVEGVYRAVWKIHQDLDSSGFGGSLAPVEMRV
ncbi:MAG TPA: hypothetical protein VEQ60_21605, partial [Longimicrobium sp.]|nr:hypothetical protein [Longimicrobium sp.]